MQKINKNDSVKKHLRIKPSSIGVQFIYRIRKSGLYNLIFIIELLHKRFGIKKGLETVVVCLIFIFQFIQQLEPALPGILPLPAVFIIDELERSMVLRKYVVDIETLIHENIVGSHMNTLLFPI